MIIIQESFQTLLGLSFKSWELLCPTLAFGVKLDPLWEHPHMAWSCGLCPVTPLFSLAGIFLFYEQVKLPSDSAFALAAPSLWRGLPQIFALRSQAKGATVGAATMARWGGF